jgi:FkbM family methyltransferase
VRSLLGSTPRVQIKAGWDVACHPESHATFASLKEIPPVRAELEGFIQRCAPGMVFVDVGAHFGIFTLAALRFGGPSALVYAIEPARVPLRVLRENVRLSQAASQVKILEVALGSRDGELAMLTAGAHGSHFLVAADGPRNDATRVPQQTLGTLFSSMTRPPTHLKMDIEGFEAEAIDGGVEALTAHHPLLFLELHVALLRNRGRDPERVLEQLEACGYHRFEVDGVETTPSAILQTDLSRIICST